MVRIFGQTDKTFTSNGDVVVRPLKAKVHKADNGDYYLDIETSLDYIDFFVEGRVIVANTPTGDQAFRIGNVNKTKSKIESRCYHVFYDSENYLIADSNVVNKNCNDALIHLNHATEPQTEFAVYSDIANVNSYRCVRKSLYEAINEVLEVWGGHLVRDNFQIGIKAEIGQDRGITIQYKKNLSDIICEENWDNVVTKILPVGQDGTLLNAVNPSASIYITSSTQYPIPYTKTVDFEQNFNRDDFPSETAYLTAIVNDLRTQATAYLAQNCIPQVNYTLKANLDRLSDVGDTIRVIDERLGLDMLTHVISFDYDCIQERYTEIEFGNFKQSLSNLVSNVSATAERVATEQVMRIVDSSFVSDYPVFNEALVRENIESGEKFTTILGKIKKFFSDLKTVAFSGSYNDLSNKPTIPTVGNGTLTIKQEGTTVGTFSANQSENAEIDLTGGGGDSVSWTQIQQTGQKIAEIDINGTTQDVYAPQGGGGSYTEGDGINITNNEISVDTTFTEASTRANIASGDTLSTIWGKIKKFFSDLKAVAFSGSYSDLTGKPNLATVATSGSYNDLSNKPTIPTNNNQLTNGAGYITSAGSCASATNSDKVDGSHAWEMQTLSAGGQTHGSSAWVMKCQHNVDGDSYFKIFCGDKSIGTKVDRASYANKANIYASLKHIEMSMSFANGYYDYNFGKPVLIISCNGYANYGADFVWSRVAGYTTWRIVCYNANATITSSQNVDIWYVEL